MDVTARRLARAEARVRILEKLVEDKTRELYQSNETLSGTIADLRSLLDAIPGALLIVEPDGALRSANGPALELLGLADTDVGHTNMQSIVDSFEPFARVLEAPPGAVVRTESTWTTQKHGALPVLVSFARLGVQASIVCVAVDLRERKQLEVELRHAQKLESIGQLASGIAHEINTPMQFIGDNLAFLQTTVTDLLRLIDVYEARCCAGTVDSAPIEALKDELDFDYLRSRAPKAAARALEGVQRVASLVSAMKAFSHPSKERAPADLNACLRTTLTVARNEYKYLADVELELGELPHVVCSASDLNQVFLNLIVNAAHAIEPKTRDSGERGKIHIRSKLEGTQAVISVQDSGCGIPEEIRHRIFDPFFTTKEVGKGTGQGLAISRSVVDAHGGSMSFESTVGVGTTFFVRIPLSAEALRRAA